MRVRVLAGEPYAEAADVWSLGVLWFELMTLCRPFEAPSLGALVLLISRCNYDEAALEACAYPPRLRR